MTPESHVDAGDRLVAVAVALATEAHRTDTRPGADGSEPYIHHPLRVAASVRSQGASPEVVAAAVLHDVAEDHPELWAERRASLPDRVVTIVELLSRRDDETYAEFVERAAADPDSRLVKLADVNDNLGSLDNLPRDTKEQRARFEKLDIRYRAALETLTAAAFPPR